MTQFANAMIALCLCGALPACTAAESPVKADQKNDMSTREAPLDLAEPFARDTNTELVGFHYGWSREAAAVPALAAELKADMERVYADLAESAAKDRDMRIKSDFPFHRYTSRTDYETAGLSDQLLSLIASHSEFTGGAHPNSMSAALLWDRIAGKRVKFESLFVAPENRDRLLNQRWCDALNAERARKRGAPVSGNAMFDTCPKLDEISIIPSDKNDDGRFEILTMIASPYVAGPYVEGSYEVELAVTPDLIAAIKPAYRPGFSADQLPQ